MAPRPAPPQTRMVSMRVSRDDLLMLKANSQSVGLSQTEFVQSILKVADEIQAAAPTQEVRAMLRKAKAGVMLSCRLTDEDDVLLKRGSDRTDLSMAEYFRYLNWSYFELHTSRTPRPLRRKK